MPYAERIVLLIKIPQNSDQSSLGPLLKAFAITSDNIGPILALNDYQDCMVITPLHPALLEMIHNRNAFLCSVFVFMLEKA